ncbi:MULTISPECIES: hypothetical protein [unclassified Croceitalea]|uniref:hypothetical protein n=1 Tax=unclassified Croceitalea TaxID=2632280 RepID=UPI0030DB2408
MKRRTFSKKLMASIMSFALLESIFKTEATGKTISPLVKHWAILLNEYCNDLKTETITQVEWQFLVSELFRSIELEEILKFIDTEKLFKNFDFPDLGTGNKYVMFPRLEGLPENTTYIKKIFGMKKGRAIIPHGHSNMTSSHLILSGEMHLRNYNTLEKQDNHLIINKTVDKIIKPSECSTISDDKDNVHWFIANSETAFTFDVIMLDLNQEHYDIYNLDIYEGQKLNKDNLRVPILDVGMALKKYGKTHHD